MSMIVWGAILCIGVAVVHIGVAIVEKAFRAIRQAIATSNAKRK